MAYLNSIYGGGECQYFYVILNKYFLKQIKIYISNNVKFIIIAHVGQMPIQYAFVNIINILET